jgi:hypothetical protein
MSTLEPGAAAGRDLDVDGEGATGEGRTDRHGGVDRWSGIDRERGAGLAAAAVLDHQLDRRRVGRHQQVDRAHAGLPPAQGADAGPFGADVQVDVARGLAVERHPERGRGRDVSDRDGAGRRDEPGRAPGRCARRRRQWLARRGGHPRRQPQARPGHAHLRGHLGRTGERDRAGPHGGRREGRPDLQVRGGHTVTPVLDHDGQPPLVPARAGVDPVGKHMDAGGAHRWRRHRADRGRGDREDGEGRDPVHEIETSAACGIS